MSRRSIISENGSVRSVPGFIAGAALLCLIHLLGALPARAMTAEEIMAKTDFVRAPFESFTMDVNISSGEGSMLFKAFSLRGEDSLVLYTEPKRERGKLLLMKGDDLWIYIPGTRRALRITPMQRLMGGVSNGDIARLRWSIDYKAAIAGESEETYELELTAIRKSATYNRMLVSIEKGTFKPLLSRVYLKSGKLLKTIVFQGFETFAGGIMATELKFVDHLRSDKESVMRFTSVTAEDIPASYFNLTALPRLSVSLSGR